MTTGTHDPPAADPSNERIFYARFPASRVIGVNFEALRSLFPERVLLNRLDGIFRPGNKAMRPFLLT
jgi:hypothetical protein